ncbi:MAG: FAD-dependent oxidoreductase, partial [Planctomycetaceae bacterium]|nr:FAD-dependent oxidoreductase [Planctomycetaceae bacterium]
MVHTTDVLIVGGGVIGLTAAYRLAAEGLTVTVVDRSRVGTEASWAGAGMLPPGNPHTAGGIEATLRGMSHVEWQGLSQELLDRTGIDNGYRQCGSVQLATTADEAQLLLESWQKQDIPAELLDRHTLHFHVPNAADNLEYGIFVPDFAQVRNPRHLKALKAACCQLNVTFVECVPDIRLTADDGYRMKCSRDEQSVAPRLEPDSGGAAGTMGDMGDPREVSAFTDCGEIKAKNIIVAAGAWS